MHAKGVRQKSLGPKVRVETDEYVDGKRQLDCLPF